MSKLAITLLSEIIERCEAISEIAMKVEADAVNMGSMRLDDEEAAERSAKEVEEYESALLDQNGFNNASKLNAGICDMRRRAAELIKLCIEYEPPL
jgi:hypothetical protein